MGTVDPLGSVRVLQLRCAANVRVLWLKVLLITGETDAEAGQLQSAGGTLWRFNHTHVRVRIPEYPIKKKVLFLDWSCDWFLHPPPACFISQAPPSTCCQPVAQEAQQGAAGSMSLYLMETEQAGPARAHGLPRWPVNSPHLSLLARPHELLSWRSKWILSPAGDRNHLEMKEVKCPSGLVSVQSSWRKTAALIRVLKTGKGFESQSCWKGKIYKNSALALLTKWNKW